MLLLRPPLLALRVSSSSARLSFSRPASLSQSVAIRRRFPCTREFLASARSKQESTSSNKGHDDQGNTLCVPDLSPSLPPAGTRDPLHTPSQHLESILIVNKLRTKPVVEAIDMFLRHLRTHYPNTTVYSEDRPDIPPGVVPWKSGPDSPPISLIITLGGDGTILHASSLFRSGAVPPVLSFSMGTLGFLLPFHIDDFAHALSAVTSGSATVLYRMRLSCEFRHHKRQQEEVDGGNEREDGSPWQVMNEVSLHRGSSPHLNTVDLYVDGQHLTEAVSDGLILSTPTGSTAYSLSAGGPIVHPSLSALVLTPICPRSLSFRPVVFPGGRVVEMKVSAHSRAPAHVSMDGQVARVLMPGESVVVRASDYPIPCINRSSIGRGEEGEDQVRCIPTVLEGAPPGKEDDWVRDINNLLQYNATFRSKALLRHERR
ncbi:ATP-NAD kinase [Gloeophyllum trabeum ATCC 11539]|uniref:ATP-NAD kinase n=1 Tax=Gloeophyllum trabeum (strain ATCC 11539 / FP-39264 / Madison 617) TaxID=670483 RepID=S7Q6I3_GLOTA|nr:ATP-NAD kinase [Gloeophyllum trabeum ATCC 11539]EPQ55028.1 ATP-NAD kinase [Gloeophyllum trabeum ATCC 11539]